MAPFFAYRRSFMLAKISSSLSYYFPFYGRSVEGSKFKNRKFSKISEIEYKLVGRPSWDDLMIMFDYNF